MSMKHVSWQTRLGIFLVLLSAVLYVLHFAIFRDAYHISIYLLGDIAFLPIEVLLVTLVLHSLLSQREKRILLEKLNMVVGAFFSEVGNTLLTYFSDFDPRLEEIRKELLVTGEWSEQDFSDVKRRLKGYEYEVDVSKVSLNDLRTVLYEKREFLLRLLENPNLLEHEEFTGLLRAVFHLTEELLCREDFRQLPPTDLEHMANDIKRAYSLLVDQWLDYMGHLKANYPFLFSLAMRTNPFDQTASPIVR